MLPLLLFFVLLKTVAKVVLPLKEHFPNIYHLALL